MLIFQRVIFTIGYPDFLGLLLTVLILGIGSFRICQNSEISDLQGQI